MKITPQKFMEEPVQHPRELLQHSFGSVLGTGPAFDVVLEFESKAAQRVKETVWHPHQKVRELPGGRLRLVLPLNSTLEVAPWILSWGPYVKVVELSGVARVDCRLCAPHGRELQRLMFP